MNAHQALRENLADGETLLWTEEPDSLAYVGWGTCFGVLFMVFWIFMVFNIPEKGSAGLGQFLFAGIGILILISSLIIPLKSLFTVYGITSKRLLIVRRFPWSVVVESYYAADIAFIRKTRKGKGNGSVVFSRTPYSKKGGTSYQDVGFFGIDDVDKVEQLIRDNFRSPNGAAQ